MNSPKAIHSPHLDVAVVLQSRFELFNLINPLIRRGHSVTLYMNYPSFAIARFGIDPSCKLRSCVIQGLFHKLAFRLNWPLLKRWATIWFSKWAATATLQQSHDLILIPGWIAKDLLKRVQGAKKPLVIVNQMIPHADHFAATESLLHSKFGAKNGDVWGGSRLKQEYELADHIRVISQYALDSFLRHGVPARKLIYNPSGDPVKQFLANESTIQSRKEGLLHDRVIQVLFVGFFTARKGAWDILSIINRLDPSKFQFTIVGGIDSQLKNAVRELSAKPNVSVVGKIPESSLIDYYAKAHVYLFPTYDEGYAQTLGQARANGLLLLTTAHCQSIEYFAAGAQGWVEKPGDVDAFVHRLEWLYNNRDKAAQLLEHLGSAKLRTFDDTARDLEDYVLRHLDRPTD